jgi:hypothetical protein
MTTDEKVELARWLAEALRVKRSEWQRWANYFGQVRNLDQALRLAEYLSRSPTVRREPKEAARIIHQVIQQRSAELRRLSPDDLAEVFGYVSRELEWLNVTQAGDYEKGSPRHHRRESGGRHRSH